MALDARTRCRRVPVEMRVPHVAKLSARPGKPASSFAISPRAMSDQAAQLVGSCRSRISYPPIERCRWIPLPCWLGASPSPMLEAIKLVSPIGWPLPSRHSTFGGYPSGIWAHRLFFRRGAPRTSEILPFEVLPSRRPRCLPHSHRFGRWAFCPFTCLGGPNILEVRDMLPEAREWVSLSAARIA